MDTRDVRLPTFGQFRPPRISVQTIVGALLALVLIWIVFGSFFTVDPEEIGVVLRFGGYARTAEPGLQFKVPWPVERVIKVPVQRQLKQEFGFRTESANVRTRDLPQDLGRESLMLTGDLNVAVVEWIVQFRIREPRQYLFHVRDVPETFRYMSEAVMRQIVGDHSVDEVLTIGRESMALQAKEELQRLCDLYGIGIEVQQLVLQDVNPPDPVKPAFNEVNQAIQEKERAINEAWADYNKSVPRSKGEAEQAIRSAEGYTLERVNNAEGDAKRFEALYAEYRKAPAVTRKRIYLETMNQILPKVGHKLILDDKAKGILPLLNLQDAPKVGTR